MHPIFNLKIPVHTGEIESMLLTYFIYRTLKHYKNSLNEVERLSIVLRHSKLVLVSIPFPKKNSRVLVRDPSIFSKFSCLLKVPLTGFCFKTWRFSNALNRYCATLYCPKALVGRQSGFSRKQHLQRKRSCIYMCISVISH